MFIFSELLSFAPYPLCECEFSCFSVHQLAIPSNSLQLGHIIEMCSWSLSNAVTSLPVKTPSRCVSTLELCRGNKVQGLILAPAVGTAGVPGTTQTAGMLLCILRICPRFIMKHIHVPSDTYNPALIFSDVLTRLTSHIKSKEPDYKILHIIVSTALWKIKEKKSHCYWKHNCLPNYHFLLFYNSFQIKQDRLSQAREGKGFVNHFLPPFPSFNKDPVPSIPAMFDSM